MASYARFMQGLHALLLCMIEAVVVAFPFLAIYAAIKDFLELRIPNRISILGASLFFVLAVYVGLPWPVIFWSFVAASATFVFGFVLFVFNAIGGGDVKLAAMSVLWLGHEQVLLFYILFSLYGGVLALVVLYLLYVVRVIPYLGYFRFGFLSHVENRRSIPYGIALSAAALQLYLDAPIVSYLVVD